MKLAYEPEDQPIRRAFKITPRFAFRSLIAAAALSSLPSAFAATININDNADQPRERTTTVFDTSGGLPGAITEGPTVVVNPFYFATAITASYAGGFDASTLNSTTDSAAPGTPGATRTIVTNGNAPTFVNGGSVVIPSNINRDFVTSPGGVGVTVFTSYSTLAQGMGWVDLKRLSINPPASGGTELFYTTPGYLGLGTYNDRTGTTAPVVGYRIDAADYSGAGNVRWTTDSSSVVGVLAGVNTYTGDTFVAGRLMVSAQPSLGIGRVNIGQGTLFIAGVAGEGSEFIINQAGATLSFANAVAGSGALTFMGDTTLYGIDQGDSQTTTLTYDSVNYSGAVTIESATAFGATNTIVLGDNSTAGSTANTGTIGTGAISVGRLDGNLGDDGAYGKTSLDNTQTTSRLRINLSGTKTIANSAIALHGRSELENTGAGSITVAGNITSGDAVSSRIINQSGQLTFTGTTVLGGGSNTQIINNSTGQLTFSNSITTGGQVDIANNSTGNLHLDGNVSGLVFIDQNGASTTRLTGNNSFTGIISVNNAGGTLEFTNSRALGSGTIKLAGGTLKLGGTEASIISNAVNLAASSNLQTDADLTFTGAFTSPAAGITLTKVGAAKLILTGNNDTFAGTFVVADNGGTLQAGDGGTTGTFGTRAITVGSGATVAVNRSDAQGVTVGNVISGAGNFEQLGTGKTIVTGVNTYTGTTLVAAGTLQVGNGGTSGNLGSGAVTIASGAKLDFARSGTIVVSSDITGAGNLVQTGPGVTALTGLNNYTGTTTITGGVLDLGNGGTTGNLGSGAVALAAPGELRLNRSDAITVANDITGTGLIRKQGAAVATLSGTVSGQSLVVEAGTLNNTGSGSFTDVTLTGGEANLTAVVSGDLDLATGTTLTLGSGAADAVSALTGTATTAVVNGTLNLNSDADSKLSNYSGSGVIEQKGTGVVTLADTTADYTGSIVLTKGVVAFATAGDLDSAKIEFNGGLLRYTESGTITLTNDLNAAAANSFLVIDGGVNWTGALSGTGIIRVSGSGVSTFTVNGTSIVNGSSVVIDGVTFSANSIDLLGVNGAADGGFVNSANPVDVTNSSDSAANFTVAQGGTAAGRLSGNLVLVKDGASSLTLTNENTHTGGTVVNAGTLIVGSDLALGSRTLTLSGGSLAATGGARTLANNVVVASASSISGTESLTFTGETAVNSTLSLTGSASTTFTGTVTGAGSVVQSGSGTTTFTNAAGFTGSYVANNGTLDLARAGDYSLTNRVTGTGSVRLSGDGITTLNSSVLNSAVTTVASGRTLDLGMNSSVSQLTALTIESGARLQGQGTVGWVTNFGTVAPGNSPGIVVVNGNFNNVGVLNMEIAGTGAAGAPNGFDQIQVGGVANLGGTLAVNFTSGVVAGNNSYRLITASSVTGAFATVTSPALPSGLFSLVSMDATGVTFSTFDNLAAAPGLNVPGELLNFSAALTQNATPFNALLGVLSTQGGAAASQALVNASPLGLGALTTLALDESRATADLMRTRLDSIRRTPKELRPSKWAAYANVTGAQADSDRSDANFDRDYFGGKAGLERCGTGGVAIGGNLGYDNGTADLQNGGGKMTQDHLSGSAYVSHQFNNKAFMYLGAFAGLSSYETERNTVLGKNSGDTNGWDLGVTGLVGYEMALAEGVSFTPYGGLVYTHAQFSAFGETGNALALNVAETQTDSLRTKLGGDLDWKLPTGGWAVRLGVGAAWEHELLDDTVDLRSSFANGSSGRFLTVAGGVATDTISVGPQVTLGLGAASEVRLGYRYQYGFGDETGQRVDLTFGTRF